MARILGPQLISRAQQNAHHHPFAHASALSVSPYFRCCRRAQSCIHDGHAASSIHARTQTARHTKSVAAQVTQRARVAWRLQATGRAPATLNRSFFTCAVVATGLCSDNDEAMQSSSSSSSSSSSDDDDDNDDDDDDGSRRRVRMALPGYGIGSGLFASASAATSRPASRPRSRAPSVSFSVGVGVGVGAGGAPDHHGRDPLASPSIVNTAQHSVVVEGDEAAAMAADAASFANRATLLAGAGDEGSDYSADEAAEEDREIVRRYAQQQPPQRKNSSVPLGVGSMPMDIAPALNGRSAHNANANTNLGLASSPSFEGAASLTEGYGSLEQQQQLHRQQPQRPVDAPSALDIPDGDSSNSTSHNISAANSFADSYAASARSAVTVPSAPNGGGGGSGDGRRMAREWAKTSRSTSVSRHASSAGSGGANEPLCRTHSYNGGSSRSAIAELQAAAAAAATDPSQSSSGSQSLSMQARHRYHSYCSKHFRWKTVLRRIQYYVPCFAWVPQYSRANLLGDVLAGVSVGVMLVPQGLTDASLANLPPAFGLYTSFFPLLCYVLMGSSKHLSVGPEVTSSILIGKTITQFPTIPDGELTDPAVVQALVSAALALSLAIGMASLGLGVLRLGFLDSILSKPMIAGFVLAVGATLLCEQMPILLVSETNQPTNTAQQRNSA